MPIQTFALLLVSVIAAAGLTVALAVASGINFVWFGIAVLLAALLVRKLKR